jgi:AcrR family transcriptional regulator
VAEARDTRHMILRQAADIASVDGLEGLSIGQLATDLGMSKAGVIGHFGSKEELQLATVDMGADMFRALVWEPVQSAAPGRDRLLAVCDTWTEYSTNPPFPGGCLMATASVEFAGRPGRVHDRLADYLSVWHRTLAAEARRAIKAGQLPESTDADTVAFSLQALTSAIKTAKYLSADPLAGARCRDAMRALLGETGGRGATGPG